MELASVTTRRSEEVEEADEMVLVELPRSQARLAADSLLWLVETVEEAAPGTILPPARRAVYELAGIFERAGR